MLLEFFNCNSSTVITMLWNKWSWLVGNDTVYVQKSFINFNFFLCKYVECLPQLKNFKISPSKGYAKGGSMYMYSRCTVLYFPTPLTLDK